MHILDSFDKKTLRDDIPEFAPGDTVKVHVNIVEGKTARVQVFQGYVMGRQGYGVRETFRVRKVSFGIGVERVFPVHSPVIDKIEVVTKAEWDATPEIGRFARIHDPEGNPIELWEPPVG